MKARRRKTPSVTSSSFENADITTEKVAAMMVQSSSQTGQERLKNICIKWDNYHCMITEFWDEAAQGIVPEKIIDNHILNTELAHIIPCSLSKYENHKQVHYPFPIIDIF